MPEKLIMVRESEWREMREALREMLTVHEAHHNHPVHAVARAALAKSEATHPTPDGCGREGKHQWVSDFPGAKWERCANCGAIQDLEGGDDD